MLVFRHPIYSFRIFQDLRSLLYTVMFFIGVFVFFPFYWKLFVGLLSYLLMYALLSSLDNLGTHYLVYDLNYLCMYASPIPASWYDVDNDINLPCHFSRS